MFIFLSVQKRQDSQQEHKTPSGGTHAPFHKAKHVVWRVESLRLRRRLLQALQQVCVRSRVDVAGVRVSLHQCVDLLLSLLERVRRGLQHVAVYHVSNVRIQTDLERMSSVMC